MTRKRNAKYPLRKVLIVLNLSTKQEHILVDLMSLEFTSLGIPRGKNAEYTKLSVSEVFEFPKRALEQKL